MDLNETQKAALTAVHAGAESGQFVFASVKSMKAFLDAGLVEGNEAAANERKEIPFRLTATGKEAINVTTTDTNTAPDANTGTTTPAAAAAPALFVIANVEPPAIVRKATTGGGRTPKYPQLDLLEVGQAIFIPSAPGDDAKKLSKGFGSMVADRNSKNKEKYFTSRGIADGFEAGFRPTDNPELYKGVSGTGIYRRPLDTKPVRKPRTPKAAPVANTDGGDTGTQTA